jgi:hypothetical protein
VEEMRPTMWARFLATWWDLFSTPWYFPLISSYGGLLFPEKMTWQKDWIYLTSNRSLKVKNMQKQANLPGSVTTI